MPVRGSCGGDVRTVTVSVSVSAAGEARQCLSFRDRIELAFRGRKEGRRKRKKKKVDQVRRQKDN